MKEHIPKQKLYCIVLAIGLSSISFTSISQEKVRPFCRFSLQDGWTDYGPSEYITRKAKSNDRSGIPVIVNQIKRKLAIRANIDIYIAEDEDNAFATVAQGRKILIIDVGFLEKLNRLADTQWGAIQVIAHEVGHHIAGFSNDRHRAELNADYWSGQSLQRLGASRSAAVKGILAFGTDFDSSSHPNKHRRAKVIEKGWDDSSHGRVDYSFCNDCR